MSKNIGKVRSGAARTKQPYEVKLKVLSNPPRSGRYSRAEGPARAGASARHSR